jgi:hypothetical protein
MTESDGEKELKPSSGDLAHTIAKAGLSAIPVIGGPAAELFSAIIVTPLSKRRDKWILSIAEGLKRLEEEVKGFKIEELSKNEMFITTVMQASQAAIRNHQKEKLESLRNAILNAALPEPPKEYLQERFIIFIEIITSWHLKVLYFLDEIFEFEIEHPDEDLEEIVRYALKNKFPELWEYNSQFYRHLVKELYDYGLIEMNVLTVGNILQHISSSGTTDMGKKFLKFIRSPLKS